MSEKMGKIQNRGKIWGIYRDTFDLAVFAVKSCTRALNFVLKIQDHRPQIQDHRPEIVNPSSRKLLIKSSIT
jgi:hypothetical protein